VVVFGLENRGKQRIFINSYVPTNMGEKAFINSVEVPNTKTTIFLRLADIFP
jgi:hypothetical protein